MTEAKDNSSLPLLLSVTGAVLVVAVGGWFFLDHDPASPTPAMPEAASAMQTVTDVAEGGADATAADADEETMPEMAPAPAEEPSADVDAELRKARLAADADILVFPRAQSALHYYGRVLEANPQDAIAVAELDAILTKVAQTVTDHLDAEEYDAAYAIAVEVARISPEHALVVATQQTLDSYTEQLVEEAIQFAQDGNDEQAVQALATAEELPARNPDYFVAIRDSIDEIREVRVAAEQDRAQRARMAANEAKAAWISSVRGAIEQGNLIEPAGASARDLLAENNRWTADRETLSGELLAALVTTSQALIDARQPDAAEALVKAATELSEDPGALDDLRVSLERAYVERESSRVANMKELVHLKAVAPRYPRRAQQRDLSGWVELFFTVTPSGATANIEVRRSEPEAVFDNAAVEAVEKWVFEPVEYRGQVINQRAAAKLVFRLE